MKSIIFFSPIRFTPCSFIHIKSCSFIPPEEKKKERGEEMTEGGDESERKSVQRNIQAKHI